MPFEISLPLVALVIVGIAWFVGSHRSKKYRASHNLIDKLLDKQQESLKAIAAKLGVTELEAVNISINRTYFHLFHDEYDFPTDEQIKAMGGSPSTMYITKTQLADLVFGKTTSIKS